MLKRVFVTATPECIMACFNIHPSQIHHLKIKDEYSGFNKIVCKKIDNNIRQILENEYNRIINNIDVGEAILYCIERNIEKGDNSQIEILRSLSSDRQDNILTNATIHTYTGVGMVVYTKNQQLKKLLSEILVDITTKSGKSYKKIVKPIKNKFLPFITLEKSITIRHFYSLCKTAGESVVITIGKDLINRGISYVSDTHLDYVNDTKNGTDTRPLCATTMILKTSML